MKGLVGLIGAVVAVLYVAPVLGEAVMVVYLLMQGGK